MRIVSGMYRGRSLRTPKGEATRPTSGMVRETLFNILAAETPESRFLDLFAGCGSVGLEALSHGASRVVFVESARPAVACLRENIAAFGASAQVVLFPVPVERALEQLARKGDQFDLIFLDPPFANVAAYRNVLERLGAGPLLAPDGIVIAQHDVRVKLPEEIGALARYRLRPIGDNALSFYCREDT